MLLVTIVTLVLILSDALEGLVDKCWAVKVDRFEILSDPCCWSMLTLSLLINLQGKELS